MMATNVNDQPAMVCHVVAMPYPGGSHIYALMNLCKEICSRVKFDILITFVVTEEWFGLIGSDSKPDNIQFDTIPNVVPSEHVRANQFVAFVEAVATKLEDPFEKLLNMLHGPPVRAIITDTLMAWPIHVGNRRNIPVASVWALPISMFSLYYHFDLLNRNGHYPIELSDPDNIIIDYIPGISPCRLADLSGRILHTNGKRALQLLVKAVSQVPKAKYLLTTSVYELEPLVFDALKPKFPFPIYPFGPISCIKPQFQLENTNISTPTTTVPEYIQWLDSQPVGSVLYISFGTYLSVSDTQLDEIVAGVRSSGIRYMLVTRESASKIKDGCGNEGFVVPWCDQLRVLGHPSVGGFLTHCGWNSIMEAIFAGVLMLTIPIVGDQYHNSMRIVEEWKIGYKVNKDLIFEGNQQIQSLTGREEISELVKKFMDPENNDRKLMRERVEKLQKSCQLAVTKGGSSDSNLDAFIRGISQDVSHN